MKKMAVLTLVMAMIIVSALPACALKKDDISPLVWADYVDWANSLIDGGRFIQFSQCGLKVWMCNTFQPVKLSRQDINEGVIGYYLHNGSEPYGMQVTYQLLNVKNRDKYEKTILASGGSDLLYATINGIPAIIYNDKKHNALCVAIVDQFGGVAVFSFFPASSIGFYEEAQNMICSIQKN